MKNIYFVILTILIGLYVINEVRKKRFSIKESIYWAFGIVVMLILSIFPQSIDFIALHLGIAYPPSLLFVICIIFLILINFRSSKKIAILQEEVIELEQNVTISKGIQNEK